jgi:hypothetical protein
VSKFIKQSVFDELGKLNDWFDEVRSDLECVPTADRGRVRARLVERLAQLEAFEKETALVASFCGYQGWGYLVRAANLAGEEAVVAVELPKECLEVPTGWCYGAGKPDYNTALKHLPKTQKLLKKVLVFIEGKREVEGDEWAEENRRLVTEAFVESQGWSELEEELWKFYKDIEPEPDPSEVWLQAAEHSRATLISSEKLPPIAAAELLDYAEAAGVEATKQFVELNKATNYPDQHWFSYLLCAYLTKQQRPDHELCFAVTRDVSQAAEFGTLYDAKAKDAATGLKKGAWDPTTTLADLATAYNTYTARDGEMKSFDDWDELEEAVRNALGRQPAETN